MTNKHDPPRAETMITHAPKSWEFMSRSQQIMSSHQEHSPAWIMAKHEQNTWYVTSRKRKATMMTCVSSILLALGSVVNGKLHRKRGLRKLRDLMFTEQCDQWYLCTLLTCAVALKLWQSRAAHNVSTRMRSTSIIPNHFSISSVTVYSVTIFDPLDKKEAENSLYCWLIRVYILLTPSQEKNFLETINHTHQNPGGR